MIRRWGVKCMFWGLLLVVCLATAAGANDKKWFVSLYGGQFTDNDLMNILALRTNFKHGYISALSVGREIWRSPKWDVGIEVEGQMVHNWGYEIYEDDDPSSTDPGWDWAPGMSYEDQNSGSSTHEEFNLAFSLRWHRFPWDRYLDTSFAVGDGISYATKPPPYETDPHGQLHGPENERYEVSRVLNYLLLELDFTHPKIDPWSVFIRIHHRSGIFGLINGVNGGSNFICGGVRYRFDVSKLFGGGGAEKADH